jgi:hypothetical protein
MYLHRNFLQLVFNILYHRVFGASLKDKLGNERFILLYIACLILRPGWPTPAASSPVCYLPVRRGGARSY